MNDLVADAMEALKEGYGKICKDLIAEDLEAKKNRTDEENLMLELLRKSDEKTNS